MPDTEVYKEIIAGECPAFRTPLAVE